jgi:short-subunit dehydrogenase
MKTPRVILITGASSGLGAASARAFVTRGDRVFGTSRTGQAGPPGVEMFALDVDRDDSVTRCIDALLARAGHIDVLVNNAGRAVVGACEETSADEARALFETNLFGVMRVVSAVLPTMRAQRSGHVINLGSASGFVGVPFHGVYAATKHALAGYSEALRNEVAPFGIHVAVIEPSAHRTSIQMARPANPLALYDPGREQVEAIIRAQIEHGPAPERVAEAIARASTRGGFRVRVGGKAHFAAIARWLLPEALFERVIRHEFRLDSLQP